MKVEKKYVDTTFLGPHNKIVFDFSDEQDYTEVKFKSGTFFDAIAGLWLENCTLNNNISNLYGKIDELKNKIEELEFKEKYKNLDDFLKEHKHLLWYKIEYFKQNFIKNWLIEKYSNSNFKIVKTFYQKEKLYCYLYNKQIKVIDVNSCREVCLQQIIEEIEDVINQHVKEEIILTNN